MTTVFVGLGNMGAPMVRRLAARTELALHDADAQLAERLAGDLGVSTLASLDGDLSAVETVVLMLPSSRVVEAVLQDPEAGLLRSLRRGALVVDMGSSEPASSRRLAREARELGVDYVDAPVSGGVSKAVTGELAIMAGGEPAAVERARPLLETMGGPVVHVGDSGAGDAVKALNNLLSAANVAAAAEVLAVGTRFGVDPETMIGVINTATGRSQATEVKFPQHILPGTWDSGFAMDLMLKDLGIAQALADDLGVLLEVAGAAHSLARRARETLGQGRDHTEVARFVQERADTPSSQAESPHDNRNRHTRGDRMSDAQQYVDDMVRRRGYVLDYHKIMAANDFTVMQAANRMVEAAYLKERLLDRKTKELIFVVSLVVARAPKGHIQSHIRVGLDYGLTPQEILEAIEIALPEAGIVAFQSGVEAWAEVVGAERLEPTVQAHEGGPSGGG